MAIARRAKASRRLNSEAGRTKSARTTKAAATVAKTIRSAKFRRGFYALLLNLLFRTPARLLDFGRLLDRLFFLL